MEKIKKELTTCPLCGSSLNKYPSKYGEGKFYYKCSSPTCKFNLKEEYTLAELHLQGVELQSTCINCGSHLKVVNGPTGLYVRCLECVIDLQPSSKWINSDRPEIRAELKSLINNYYYTHKKEISLSCISENKLQYNNIEDLDKKIDEDLKKFSKKIVNNYKSKELVKQEVSSINSKTDLTDIVIETLTKDIKTPYNIKSLSNNLKNFHKYQIKSVVRNLIQKKILKVVGVNKVNHKNIYTETFQIKESPLNELSFKCTSDNNYISLHKYAKDTGISYSKLRELINREGRTERTFARQNDKGTIFKVFSIKFLNEVYLKNKKLFEIEEESDKKTFKKPLGVQNEKEPFKNKAEIIRLNSKFTLNNQNNKNLISCNRFKRKTFKFVAKIKKFFKLAKKTNHELIKF